MQTSQDRTALRRGGLAEEAQKASSRKTPEGRNPPCKTRPQTTGLASHSTGTYALQ